MEYAGPGPDLTLPILIGVGVLILIVAGVVAIVRNGGSRTPDR